MVRIAYTNLEEEASQIRTHWSCQDLILNGDETTIDDCPATDPSILDVRTSTTFDDTNSGGGEAGRGGIVSEAGIQKTARLTNTADIRIRPNPTTDWVHWLLADSTSLSAEVKLYSTGGQLLAHRTFVNVPGNWNSFSLAALPAGIYFLSVNLTGQAPLIQKIVKL